MTIRNVNGRNVYVIDPGPVTGRTTSGRSWATLYSDLRWKVWEETQKNVLRQAELQGMAYKAQLDIYEQAQRDIRRSIVQLQQLQAEALAGGTTARQIANQAAQQARLDQQRQKFNAQQASRREVTTTTTEPATDILGRPIAGETIETKRTVTRQAPGIERTIIGEGPTEPIVEGEPSVGERRQAGLEFLQQEIDQLEEELRQLQRPQLPIMDIGEQSRRAFERDVGVIGQGGGPFGLAPRRRRTQPRVDQPLAQARIEQAVPGLIEQQREVARQEAILRNLYESRALYGADEEIISNIREQEQRVEEARRPLEELMQATTPRRAGELLLRDRPQAQRGGGEPFVPIDRTAPIATVATEPDFEVSTAPTATDFFAEPPLYQEAPMARQPIVEEPTEQFQGAMVAPTGGVMAPAPEPVVPTPSPEVIGGTGFGERASGDLPIFQDMVTPETTPEAIVPRIGPTPTVPTTAPAIPAGPPQATIEQARAAIAENPDIVKEAREHFRGLTVEGERVLFPQAFFGGRDAMVKEYLTDQMRARTPVEGSIPVQPTREERRKTTTQRKNKYLMDVVTEGTRLAQQPKRLARIARTTAEDVDRPKHYVLVEQLYEVNKSRGDAFKKTYDEITRFFRNKPELREQAHAYLVALDTLANEKPMK
jgi:hypothetical protein